MIVAQDGSILFSDPWYGRMPVFGVEREKDLDFQGVYRIPPGGDPQLLADDFEQPNGLCFSPDESLLYINDTPRAHIRVRRAQRRHDRERADVLREHRQRRDRGGHPDGMKCDEAGNIYVTGPGRRLGSARRPSTWGRSRCPRTSAT